MFQILPSLEFNEVFHSLPPVCHVERRHHISYLPVMVLSLPLKKIIHSVAFPRANERRKKKSNVNNCSFENLFEAVVATS